MKRTCSLFGMILLLSCSTHAQGTFPLEWLRPILMQKPVLANYLYSTLDFAEGGMANRIGSVVNEKLGGKRLGPYEIKAKPKGAAGDYVFTVIVYTESTFYDEQGRVSTLEKAASVTEKLLRVEIKPIEDR